EDAVILSNFAAGCVVRKLGTAVVTYDEVKTFYGTEPKTEKHPFYKKCVSLEEACVVTQAWRQHGLKIGFTNGCFDVLHPGHLSTIQTARKNCDKLIVGLNTDTSIRTLKGLTRPFQNETVRAEILASLQDVDLIVLFDSYTPKSLIEALQPDVLVKGAEYHIEDLAGAQEIIARGGRVILTDMKKEFSTTRFIEKIQQSQQKRA
ncbi:MAG: adenylyltransferase/cytidyltransferase family protein, partial [Holosporales bacterium]|nr:adenylyltransferase/cytidyltransferase family protein [Holosporales bacterium]